MEVNEEGGEVFTADANTERKEETEDERAMRAVIASATGTGDTDALTTGAISSAGNKWTRPADEGEAYLRDVANRLEAATLDDYERVPVEQSRAAHLRGMGWKPSQAASRTRTTPDKPCLSASRPALLGIGAKIPDDGSSKKKLTKLKR